MKVGEIPYRRAELAEIETRVREATDAIKRAKNIGDMLDARKLYLAVSTDVGTASTLAEIRFTCNMFDPFYAAECDYYDTIGPTTNVLGNEYARAVLESPFAAEYGLRVSPDVLKGYENNLAAADPRIVPEMEEENHLTTAYSKLMASMLFSFRGEEMPLTLLKRYLTDPDRATRKEAHVVLGRTLEAHAEELDGLFDDLVHVRDRMAKKLGYDNFIALGYRRMNRICFDEGKVGKFRACVRRDVVPVVARLKARLAAELGIDEPKVWDDDIYCAGGNPAPILDSAGILAAARAMYRDMGEETGAFIDEMFENEAFDVESRAGKWGGGYCTEIPAYRQPFILANFNGSSADVDTITHEVGHALNAWYNFRTGVPFELGCGGMETAETHSMSMEFFAWKYMDAFFGGDAERYRKMHLANSMSFVPYGTEVDEFQHIVYANPDLTPAERKARWRELDAAYRPWLDTAGAPYLEEGTRWQYQAHIYESPFYYIDYCLAQTVAFQFLLASRDDYDKAFARYIAHVKRGGSFDFETLVRKAGLLSPFADGTLGTVYSALEQLLAAL